LKCFNQINVPLIDIRQDGAQIILDLPELRAELLVLSAELFDAGGSGVERGCVLRFCLGNGLQLGNEISIALNQGH
jgi:hypothetical protein